MNLSNLYTGNMFCLLVINPSFMSDQLLFSFYYNAIGLNSGFWGVAKVFGKNPTLLTILIVVIPVLGIAVVNT